VNGGQIVAESNNLRTIVYIYDASGAPIGMMYRTPSYAEGAWDVFWYEKNLQGDIIAIYNASGTKVATYTYSDAWGNHSVSYSNGGASTGAQYNPFRYRGYYYDTDLGMYYLQSRYYDAKVCRFINADIYVSTGQGIIGFNIFAYCRNQSPTRVDDEGTVDQDFVGNEDILDESAQDGKGLGGTSYPTSDSSSNSSSSSAVGTGYSTFSAFKSANGSAGDGYHWHHLVEQCQSKTSRSGFSSYDINNTNNIYAVKDSVHSNISRFYSSKQDITDNMVFRDWLTGQSFEEQHQWGVIIFEHFNGGK
jgi:RHS repeat-associated protein